MWHFEKENSWSSNTLDKFTKGTDNLNLVWGNQMASYNNVGLGYEPKNYNKSFRNICN